ncbi:MAG: AsmA family protein [Phycisphaerae bacterium]|nr:AsmA family protein [Phycisphaerae bacterium]MDD5381038.1 AsmA family protein [Phycisphaerae bacterium]
MKTKKTVLKSIVLPLVILLVILTAAFFLVGTSLIKSGIEKAASSALGVPVTIKDIDLSILRGRVIVQGLVVKNPPGYANETLLELGEATVNLNIGSLMSDTVKIQLVKLDDTKLTMEQKGLSNNLKEVLDNLPKEEKKAEPKEEGKNLLINHLEITNTDVRVKVLPVPGKSDTISLKLDPIIMDNLGTDKKLSIGILAAKVLKAIATGVAKQGAGVLPDEMVKGIGSSADKATEMGKAATEEGKKALDSGKEALEGIKGLFKK